MKEHVLIKGNRYGIVLVLDPEIPFEDLLIEIGVRFDDSSKYFNSNTQSAITFEGRELDSEEIDRILDLIKKRTTLRIPYVIDNRKDTEEQFQRIIEGNQKESGPMAEAETRYIYPEKGDGLFYKGTLRSGQTLEASGSLVMIGDVNPGATVLSNGNIIILGSLKGTAIAGASGNRNAFVLALSMTPMQIQISDIIGRAPDKPKKRLGNKNPEAQIAFVEEDNIYIEPVSKSVLNDINI
ncbi:MAG: septum site-determining protein MinC [Bacteroides sp.]|nr:septum site-determining protein MinC [Bacteroides sp.]MCM1549353.1 septum site-determining protein MinC [Clostridium sp.]